MIALCPCRELFAVKLGVVDKENGAAYGYYEETENETGCVAVG